MKTKTLLACLVLALLPAIHAGVINGDFQTGDLTGWTTYNTTTGTAGLGMPAVRTFDVTGGGASLAAAFEVGMTSGNTGTADYEGGGIFQVVNMAAGAVTISFDWAESEPFNFTNASAGRLELLLDGSVIATQADQQITALQVIRGNLSGNSTVTAGNHEIRIQVTRNYFNAENTPFEYIDNVTLAGGAPTGTPEPGSALLILTGVGLLAAGRRRR